jgi:subtilisin-like proprotein convertase family protein
MVHTLRGDLSLLLISPSGFEFRLKCLAPGDVANSLATICQGTLSNESLNGIWKPRVTDNPAGDIAYIDS